MDDQVDFFLDITTEVCPMTFVRTKLLLEQMVAGQIGEIRLCGVEPLTNVPRSLGELGNVIVSVAPEPGEAATGIHRLIFRKV
jgi:TusA-related sulfurtransferase